MSPESTKEHRPPLLAKFARACFFWRRQRPEFAHPWTAYRPATYLAGTAPDGIVMAPLAHTLLAEASRSQEPRLETLIDTAPAASANTAAAIASFLEMSTQPAVKLLAAPVAAALPVVYEAAEKIAEPTVIAAPRPTLRPVTLALVSDRTIEQPEPVVLPALAASTGENFMLAARLRGVEKLNRRHKPAASAPKKSFKVGINRPADRLSKPKRTRTITPPAVLRRKLRSAQIIHLDLASTLAQKQKRRIANVA